MEGAGQQKTLAPSQTLKGREFYVYSRGATLIAFFSISLSISCEKPTLATPDATTVKLSWKGHFLLVIVLRGNHPPVPTCLPLNPAQAFFGQPLAKAF
jgi:hypothetical protein